MRRSVKIIYSDTIDHKEYESKMQKLMDNYIAAEDVIRITNPVDILDKKGFEDELGRLGSPRARADAIRTRMTRSINTRWDENPLYYKKFSERIEEALQAYKDKRISEKEYFDRMNEIKEDYQKGDSGIEYPDSIKNQPDAQAFYGVTADVLNEETGAEYQTENNMKKISREQLAELSILIEEIVSKYTKVDWYENTDVHNRIDQEVEDLLFDFAETNNIHIGIDLIDRILKEVRAVALKRY